MAPPSSGLLLDAEEASSARAIGGGLGREEAVAWELFSPVERFLIVAVIGLATVESKKNRLICQLKKSVELRDEVLSSMQQKVDSLCEQLNNTEEKPGTWANTEVESSLNGTFGSGSVKVDDCGCWICYQHREQIKGNYIVKTSGANEMALSNETEHEEHRMSDLSDWASSVTSASETQLNNHAIEHDVFNLKRKCEEKDAIIKELNTSVQSSNVATLKRISELENIICRKNTIITRLKKDMVVLEQKLTRLQRASSSTSSPNYWQIPPMMDNLLYDMDSTTSPSSSDSDSSPKNRPQAPLSKAEEVSFENDDSPLKGQQKSAPAKVSSSFTRQTDCHSMPEPVTPLREISMNNKSKPPSSRQRQVSTSRDSKRIKKQNRKILLQRRDGLSEYLET
ncbi:putative DNA binding protein [Hibiscus syriacus]|uniref:DNA binding protein n=1 Tax=Hibiscus syriacus TaxID=106335 RepID=A0A6A3B434_HIBSY|nr:putative DNA binding protein [Hibiscus syriacus]